MPIDWSQMPDDLPVERRAALARRAIREVLAAISDRLERDDGLKPETRETLREALDVLDGADADVVAHLEEQTDPA